MFTEKDIELLCQDLKYIAPPQQDHSLLASSLLETSRLLESPVAKVIAEYFRLFGNGYAFWQQSYNYPRIHEYFWIAYTNAKRALELIDASVISAGDKQLLETFLMNISISVIEDSNGENSLVCSMPLWLKEAAQKSNAAMREAQKALTRLELPAPLHKILNGYVDMNLIFSQVLQICGEIYLIPWKVNPDPEELAQLEAQVLDLLEQIKTFSRELYSELRAHVAFCTRNAHQYIDNGGTSLRIQQSDFTLRSICYAGPDLIEALYKKFGDDKGVGEIQRLAKEKTGLDLHDIRAGYLNETFETSIGIEMMLPIYLELSAQEDGITFTLPDGENLIDYTLDSFRITVTKFGAISVDFQFNLGAMPKEGVTVSHLRVFEAMMGGHMGVFESVWNDYPTSDKEFDFVSPEAINFVATFRKFSQWVQLAKKHFPNGAQYTSELREIENKILVRWEDEFNQFGDMLKDPSRSILYDEDEAQLSGLQAIYQETRQAFSEWTWIQSDLETDDATDKQLKDEVRRLFPKGRLYFYLSGIGEEIIKRFQQLLVSLAEGYNTEAKANELTYRYRKEDIRGQFWFEREYGWQTVNLVNQLVLRRADGTIFQPMTPTEIQKQLVEHPDFKGFQVTSREARAGIDDWYFATPLDISKTNLATIRSHTTDVFYVEQNRVFIYMPDDPQFITEQYVDTANWAGNLAVVLIATQIFCKELIEDIESQLNNYESGLMAEDELRVLRGKIQITNRRIEQVMDLVRGFAMTKYVDHSELLRAIVKSSRIDFLADILQDHATTLNRYYVYMGDLLAGHVRYGDA